MKSPSRCLRFRRCSARLAGLVAVFGMAVLAPRWMSTVQPAVGQTSGATRLERASSATNASRGPAGGTDIVGGWYEGLNLRTSCSFDNGPPLDDEGHPAAQLSDTPNAGAPAFIAAAADDFVFTSAACPGGLGGVKVTSIRAAFRFFGDGEATATPRTTFQGVYVSVYPDNSSHQPDGHPDLPAVPGGPMVQVGNVIASEFVPVTSLLNETLLSGCTAIYRVDLPVQFTVLKDTTYWLSIVPRFIYPPQCSYAISSNAGTGFQSYQGFPQLSIAFWTAFQGNGGFCPGHPANTFKDLSFILTGEEADASVTGACCTDDSASCSDGINHVNCQLANERFTAGQACAGLSPPCGTGTGACCLPDGPCQNLTPAACQSAGGQWSAGTCSTAHCAPTNGLCANAILVSSATTPFSTVGAVTDGPADSPNPPCTLVNQDIWFKYTASCTGTGTALLCGANYDTAISVYQGWSCNPLGVRVTCNNDACGTASSASFATTSNAAYLIRVGGNGSATGSGVMTVACVPTGSGACCMGDHSCWVITQAQCQTAGGTYTSGRPCSAITCPPPANDLCANAILISSSVTSFTTFGAGTDGPADTPNPPCTNVQQDVWFQYNATCNGQLTASLCAGTAYNSAMAIYSGCNCASLGAPIGCDNDSCGAGGASSVTVSVVNGQCYLIRIGGEGTAVGAGQLAVSCGSPGDSCAVDLDHNCVVDGDDVTLFVNALLGITVIPTGTCSADINGDSAVDGNDIAPFIARFLIGSCCCPGDVNGDHLINGLDIQSFVSAMLAPPPSCSATFNAADANHDGVIDLNDLGTGSDGLFVDKLLNGAICP